MRNSMPFLNVSIRLVAMTAFAFSMLLDCSPSVAKPNLVITASDIELMRLAIDQNGRFASAYQQTKQNTDERLALPIAVPTPKDGGGGYTHEQHKRNYKFMYDAAVIYQLSQDRVYADAVRDLLLAYADVYPNWGLHPKRKVKSQNAGILFWQSLNEAMWLVYTIQAYDLVKETLSLDERLAIESKLLKPIALFLSDGQPSTFNKVHNHGTWATAGVGMAGYVLNEPEWVEKALYDLEKSGKGGFLKQLDELFSPQGYYNEGPYYQRFALLPFVTFASAIENNEPEREIFKYRDGVLLKAIDTTIQLSYNGRFFPINDAIKSKGIDTIELVQGVTVAYGITGDTGLLSIANQQDQVVLTGDGLRVAQALDEGMATPYEFKSVAFGDGSQGDQGALVVMRSSLGGDKAVLFKPASQGLGHGHFDKLTWQLYDHGAEIVLDYGAARFLNVEAKYGGRYLPENTSYAKQTVAHNTIVVNEQSHFAGDVTIGNQHWPTLRYFQSNMFGHVTSASIDSAYEGVSLTRTLALIDLSEVGASIVIDIFDVEAKAASQFDLPLHYDGQLIDTSFARQSATNELRPLGTDNGYQHLWLKATAGAGETSSRVTWLNDNGHFYSLTSPANEHETYLFTQIGANDPNFNLRNEQGFIRRVKNKTHHRFFSIIEPHGDYNPSKEYTVEAVSRIANLKQTQSGDLALITFNMAGVSYLIAINNASSLPDKAVEFVFQNQSYPLADRLGVFVLSNLQE